MMNQSIRIGNQNVGAGQPTLIIAEAGSNHNQKLSQAKELIDAASQSGVDVIKFQFFEAEDLYPADHPAYQTVKSCELPYEWIPTLIKHARKRKIMLAASAFSLKAVALIDQYNLPFVKCASSEVTNLPLLRAAAKLKKPMLISTGLSNLADIYEAVGSVRAAGASSIVLLHCVALYPVKPEQVNLAAMDTLRNAFHLPVGFSDHTLGSSIATSAVARGACVIEKHFTLSRKMKGLDHFYALEPDELKSMAIAIREVEKCIGTGEVRILNEERILARRKSIIAKINILKSTTITIDKIEMGRPATGIEPRFLNAVIGQKAKNNIKKGEVIKWEMLQ